MNNFLSLLVHTHSGLRWVVLILLLVAIYKAYAGWRGKKEFTAGDKKLFMFTMMAFHTQILIGLVLYFISPKVVFVAGMMKDTMLRFYAVEHLSMMIIAMVLITIGHSKAKKIKESEKKFKKIFVFYTISLILILASIPWPFRAVLGANWF